VNREGHVDDMMVGGHLGHNDYEMIEFSTLGGRSAELLPWTSGGQTLACLGA